GRISRADHLAVPRLARNHGGFHRQHLHTLGYHPWSDTHCHHTDRLVLAGKTGSRTPSRERDMADRVEAAALDVSKLPTVVFGIRSLTWWGIIGMMTIEGMVFLLMIASYFYLH